MIRLAGAVVACAVLVPAAAGTSTARSPVALTAWPARVVLDGTGRATVRIANSGTHSVVLDVRRAGFALDVRGRPRIVPRGGPRTADAWISLRPGSLTLRPGKTAALTVAATVPPRAEPGDHDALVLVTSRPRRGAGVAVRMRIGIVVVVRAPGPVVRSLRLTRLRVLRSARRRLLELTIVNRGNVTETFPRGRIVVSLARGGTRTDLRSPRRQLRPRSRGIVQFSYRGRLRGWTTVTVTIGRGAAPAVRRSYRVRL